MSLEPSSRRPLHWLRALLAAVSISVPWAGSARALDGAAIVRGAGQMKAEGAKDWHDLTTADLLTAGVSVQAAADQPLEMNLPDGVSVTLEPTALVRWMPAGKLPNEINKWTKGYCLVLEEGELEVRMPPSPKGSHAFLVSTKAGTLTDWRGQLHVRVRGDSTAAAIYEGALVVGSNGQGFPVYDGAGILMRRGVNPDKSKGIPAPPEWDDKVGGFLIQSNNTIGSVDLGWKPVAGATTYRVEITSDPSMVRVVQRAAIEQTHLSTTQAPGTGGYWAHVRAVTADGIVGQWSTPRRIRVLRYSLPEGGTVARDGAIMLPRGTSLSLLNAEGLEVAFENVTGDAMQYGLPVRRVEVPLYWSALVGSIRLPEYAAMRVVHLRDPGNAAQARLVIVRRELRADVALSPANARWPGDPIDVRVTLMDPSGRIDVTNEHPNIQAMLDLSPLGVAWHRDGNTWTGTITPRLISSDTVVRVVVTDSSGLEIGRGFVELEPRSLQASR